jgi:hypothetical protein
MNRFSKRANEQRATPRPATPPGGGAAGTPYPDYDVTSPDKWAYDWDEKTRQLVLDRFQNVPAYRFFSAEEARLLEALCARAIPQEDRPPAGQIPIAPWIDERLYQGEGNGYRYEDMPDDRTAYKQALYGLNQSAQALFGVAFIALSTEQQDEIIRRLADGSAPGKVWQSLPAKRFFQAWMGEVIGNYYAHPAAWAEIGFNGPASPRGHIRLRLDQRDPWEAREKQPRSSVELVKQAGQTGADAKGGPTH